MGRGDKRTRRGKIFKASYGNVRAKTTKKGVSAETKGGQSGSSVKKATVAKKTK